MKHHPTDRDAEWMIVPALVAAGLLVAGMVLLSGCAGYRYGNHSLYPTDVHTVHVPIFESDSFRRQLGERLTEAVIKEIELKTPYKVVAADSADSVLSGRILVDTKRVVVEDAFDDPREINIGMRIVVRWTTRHGDVLREAQPIPLPENMATIGDTASLFPEVGQSVVTQQQRVIEGLAGQIVAMMEIPW